MSGQVRLGIVGLGGAAMQMLPSLLSDDRLAIAAVAEQNPVVREAFAVDFAVPAYESWRDLAADPGVDAVYIATPHAFHAEQAIGALELGKHVLVEKPLALTVQDCLAVEAASRASGAHVIVGHTHAFDSPIRAMRDIILSGRLGAVAMINSFSYGNFLYRPRRPEELDTSLGGGIIFNQVPHQVDIVRLLGGGLVRSVRSAAFVLDPDRPTEGSHTTFLEFEGGAAATLVYSGYDRFDSDEFHGWVDETGRQVTPTYGDARRALRSLTTPQDEAGLKSSRAYSSAKKGALIHSTAARHQPHFGVLIVNCERGDLRASPNGVVVYDDDGATEIAIPSGGPFPDKRVVVDDLYRAAALDQPSIHDAAWAAATIEVCLAILTSAHERREVGLKLQVSARSPDASYS